MLTRNGLDWTRKFPAIVKAIGKLKAKQALIDGELVVENDPEGISSFSLLQQELKSGRQDRLTFYVFDLMYLDGFDLRPLPLTERKGSTSDPVEARPGKRSAAFERDRSTRPVRCCSSTPAG